MVLPIFKYFFNYSQKVNFIILVIVMVIASFLELIGITLIIPLIEIFNGAQNQTYYIFFNEVVEKFNFFKIKPLFSFLILFFIFFLFKSLFLVFYYYLEAKFISSFKENLSNKFFLHHLMTNHMIIEKNTAELLNSTINEVDIATNYINSFNKILLDIIIIFVFLIFLLNYNFIISVISISILFFFLINYLFFFKNFISKLGEKRLFFANKRTQYLDEGFKGKKIIKILNSEKFFYSKFHLYNRSLRKISVIINLISNLPKILFELVGVVSILVVFIFSSNLNYSGNTLELLGVFLFAFFRIVPSLNRIAGNYQTLRFSKPSLQLMINLNDLENIEDNENNYNDTKIIFVNNILLKFENFSYHYKNKDYILKNINLFINKNSKVGITGHSGSGKSTLLDILSGTIKLNGNPILVDGKIINEKSYNWRQILSYVPQKTFIIEDTLRNNVLFGINKDLIKDYFFNTILETVNLKKLITKLPNGVETVIKENGNNLSGGEVQRIGIARALLRKPQILLLDEVTSNLDLETEAKVIDDLLKIKNLTIISVSHRLASFKGFDVIYNLSGGSLNEIKN